MSIAKRRIEEELGAPCDEDLEAAGCSPCICHQRLYWLGLAVRSVLTETDWGSASGRFYVALDRLRDLERNGWIDVEKP